MFPSRIALRHRPGHRAPYGTLIVGRSAVSTVDGKSVDVPPTGLAGQARGSLIVGETHMPTKCQLVETNNE